MQAERNKIENKLFSLIRLEFDQDFKSDFVLHFDCDNDDLSEFFQKDAINYHKELMAVTYYLQPREATNRSLYAPVALVSFLNDNITITKEERKTDKKSFWNFLRKRVSHPKRHFQSFPAVKIGRLAVDKEYQRQDIGTSLLNLTKKFFLTNNRTGCRFLTVDAYNCEPVTNFYIKNNFQFYYEKDKNDDTRIMFFDLKSFADNHGQQ